MFEFFAFFFAIFRIFCRTSIKLRFVNVDKGLFQGTFMFFKFFCHFLSFFSPRFQETCFRA